jgi:hypothetical protein
MSKKNYIRKHCQKIKNKTKKGMSNGVRLSTPFTMRCVKCEEFIFKGRKHNARKVLVKDENYLGIEIYRFYIKCPKCESELSFKTDPKNGDYAPELGCRRINEIWGDSKREERMELKKNRETEERDDKIILVENRAMDNLHESKEIERLFKLKKEMEELESVNLNDLVMRLKDAPGRG